MCKKVLITFIALIAIHDDDDDDDAGHYYTLKDYMKDINISFYLSAKHNTKFSFSYSHI